MVSKHLVANDHTEPGLRTPAPLYRVETLWCQWCDTEIGYHEVAAQIGTMSGERDVHGPYHNFCASDARDAFNKEAGYVPSAD